MALSPVVFSGALPLARAWARRRKPPPPSKALHVPRTGLDNHVVVAGYGRTGRAVVDALQRASVPYVVVEFNHGALAGPLEQGLPVVWGDISSEGILRAAGIPQARMLVMAVPDWNAIRLGIDRAKDLNPRLFVVARATAAHQVEDLRALRADVVVQPEFEGGIEMVRQALQQCERTDVEIDNVTTELRKALYQPPES